MNKRMKYSILIVCLTVAATLLTMWLIPDTLGYPRDITQEYARNTLVPEVYEIVQIKYILPLCAVILALLGVFVWSMLESVAAGHPLLTAVCVIFAMSGLILDIGLLAVWCEDETVTWAILRGFPESLQEMDSLFPVGMDLEDGIRLLQWLGILALVFLFQWWMLSRRWRIVRYLPLSIYAAIWLFGEYAYLSDGGWGGLIVGYMLVPFGMIGVFITGLACIIWHIRKYRQKQPQIPADNS